jgi:hypothetical protein
MSATGTTIQERLEKFVEDTVTLDVVTFTGIVKFDSSKHLVAPQGAGGKPSGINFDKIFDDVVAQLAIANQTELQMLAYTRAQWDRDSVTFVSKDPNPGDLKLIEAHQKAVESAQKSRMEAVKMVADFIGGIVLK